MEDSSSSTQLVGVKAVEGAREDLINMGTAPPLRRWSLSWGDQVRNHVYWERARFLLYILHQENGTVHGAVIIISTLVTILKLNLFATANPTIMFLISLKNFLILVCVFFMII